MSEHNPFTQKSPGNLTPRGEAEITSRRQERAALDMEEVHKRLEEQGSSSPSPDALKTKHLQWEAERAYDMHRVFNQFSRMEQIAKGLGYNTDQDEWLDPHNGLDGAAGLLKLSERMQKEDFVIDDIEGLSDFLDYEGAVIQVLDARASIDEDALRARYPDAETADKALEAKITSQRDLYQKRFDNPDPNFNIPHAQLSIIIKKDNRAIHYLQSRAYDLGTGNELFEAIEAKDRDPANLILHETLQERLAEADFQRGQNESIESVFAAIASEYPDRDYLDETTAPTRGSSHLPAVTSRAQRAARRAARAAAHSSATATSSASDPHTSGTSRPSGASSSGSSTQARSGTAHRPDPAATQPIPRTPGANNADPSQAGGNNSASGTQAAGGARQGAGSGPAGAPQNPGNTGGNTQTGPAGTGNSGNTPPPPSSPDRQGGQANNQNNRERPRSREHIRAERRLLSKQRSLASRQAELTSTMNPLRRRELKEDVEELERDYAELVAQVSLFEVRNDPDFAIDRLENAADILADAAEYKAAKWYGQLGALTSELQSNEVMDFLEKHGTKIALGATAVGAVVGLGVGGGVTGAAVGLGIKVATKRYKAKQGSYLGKMENIAQTDSEGKQFHTNDRLRQAIDDRLGGIEMPVRGDHEPAAEFRERTTAYIAQLATEAFDAATTEARNEYNTAVRKEYVRGFMGSIGAGLATAASVYVGGHIAGNMLYYQVFGGPGSLRWTMSTFEAAHAGKDMDFLLNVAGYKPSGMSLTEAAFSNFAPFGR